MSHLPILEIFNQNDIKNNLNEITLLDLQNQDINFTQEDFDLTSYNQVIKFILDVLLDKKASNISVYVAKTCKMNFEFLIIANGSSTRNSVAIAEHLMQELKDIGVSSRAEGIQEGQWICITHESIFSVNILTPIAEEYFKLKNLYDFRKTQTLKFAKYQDQKINFDDENAQDDITKK